MASLRPRGTGAISLFFALAICFTFSASGALARMFHELLWRDREDGLTPEQPQGVEPEAYLNGTSQGTTPQEARKDVHIRARHRSLQYIVESVTSLKQ